MYRAIWPAVLACLGCNVDTSTSQSRNEVLPASAPQVAERAIPPLPTGGVGLVDGLRKAVTADLKYVRSVYEHLHRNPELSFKERETSDRLADEMRKLGFEVTTHVGSGFVKRKAKGTAGVVHDGVDGYGVVAVMRNGEGPTLMIRTDMDGLPLQEKSGLPYASQVTSQDWLGVDAPVMHACGHDVHMATWLGTARQLVEFKERWRGTLVMIAQPAEELGLGAVAMLDDGLFQRFPHPDYNLALHVTGQHAAGTVAFTKGFALASVDTVDIHVKGVGGHGSLPHLAKDPVVLASHIVVALQTLVSREVDPLESGVVSVGAFRAGYKHNIIPDEAHLQITVRSYTDEVRNGLLTGIKRIARGQALSAGMPESLMPVVEVEPDSLPATYNQPELAESVLSAIRAQIGAENVEPRPPIMGGEDFSLYARTESKIPSFFFWIGGVEPDALSAAAAGAAAPASNHSPFFAPVPDPTLRTGIEAMTASALHLLGGAGDSMAQRGGE